MPRISENIKLYLDNNPEAVWVLEQMHDAYRTCFYGRLSISFEAGKVILTRYEQTRKPPKIRGNNGNTAL